MKKFLIMIIAILLITSLTVALVACADYDEEGRVILKTPKLTVNGNTVSWSSVKNADKYGIVINDDETNEITITGTNYTVILGGTNNVRVRAIGDLKKYGFSEYSSNVSVTTAGKLASPTMNDIVINEDGTAKFSWTSVEGAGAYRLEVKSEGTTLVNEDINGNEYTLDADKIKAPAYYSYRVKALSAGTDADSEFTNTKNYSKSITLSAPESPKQSTTNSYANIEFTAPEYANRYTVEAYNDELGLLARYSVNVASESVQLNINNIPIETPGEYKVRVRAEHSTNRLCAPSEYVEVMKNDGTTPLTLTLYEAPKNITLDGSMLTWDGVADGAKYVLNYESGGNSTTTDSTTDKNFDLSTSSRIKASGFAGLLVDVTMYVGKDLEKGILDGLKSDIVNYTYVEKPDLITEGEFNGYYGVDSIAKLNYINTEPTAKYVLTKNIDCQSGIITPITKEFKGILDGNGYSINRFTLKIAPGDSRTFVSLFGDIAVDAEIKNLGVFDATVSITDNELITAGLIARTNNGKITNVNVKANISVQNTASAIALENNGAITNVFYSGTISGNNTVGAIVANNTIKGSITNARVFTSNLSVAASSKHNGVVYLGGIVGENTGTIKYAGVDNTTMTAQTHVTNQNVYLGGIAGRSAGSISTAYVNSTGRTITAITNARRGSKAYSGGLVGLMSSGSIADCYVIGGAYISANYSASFAGEIRGASSIADSYTANVNLDSHENYIVASTIEDGAVFRNLYYYTNIEKKYSLSSDGKEISGIIRTDRTMNNVNIDSMSTVIKYKYNTDGIKVKDKDSVITQSEYLALNDMLYFAKGGTYVNSITRSSLDKREVGKVYSGNGEEISNVTKFDSAKATSGTTSYDTYTRTLSDGTVITLTKSFKITN